MTEIFTLKIKSENYLSKLGNTRNPKLIKKKVFQPNIQIHFLVHNKTPKDPVPQNSMMKKVTDLYKKK